ncbi:MAG: hypothetical protein AB7F40_11040 [Victivallaceae bacterium]|nr:hypothetical protein [Victivallaceae bacterium]
MDKIPSSSIYYVVLENTACAWKTNQNSTGAPAGTQYCAFYRSTDYGSNLGLCGRHNGVGNLAYADGHVGDTRDTSGLFKQSKCGYILDNSGMVLHDYDLSGQDNYDSDNN